MTPTKEALGSFIWEQVLSERMCGARMAHIATSERLSDRDRADMLALVADEHNHAAWLRECAGRYGERPEYPGTWDDTITEHIGQVRGLSPEALIVTIYVPERYAVKVLAREAAIFREAGDAETASCFEQILGEERRHVDVNGRILRKLLDDAVVGGEVREFYRSALKAGYRQFHYDFLRSR